MTVETVWVGDSTCKGTHASASGLGYSSLVCQAEGWVEHNFAVSGSGFLNPPTTFAAQIGQARAAVDASKVGYVFVMGGVDDSSERWGLQDIRAAAASCVDEARKAFPQARIVVGVGPSCIDKDTKVQHRRDLVFASIRMGAKDRDAMVIAHMERVCGSDPDLTADGQHPNDSGYKLLAQRIIQAVTTAWPPQDRPVTPVRTYQPGNLDWMLSQDRRHREQEKSKREANRPTATETGQTTEHLNELAEVLDVQQELLDEQQKALEEQQRQLKSAQDQLAQAQQAIKRQQDALSGIVGDQGSMIGRLDQVSKTQQQQLDSFKRLIQWDYEEFEHLSSALVGHGIIYMPRKPPEI